MLTYNGYLIHATEHTYHTTKASCCCILHIYYISVVLRAYYMEYRGMAARTYRQHILKKQNKKNKTKRFSVCPTLLKLPCLTNITRVFFFFLPLFLVSTAMLLQPHLALNVTLNQPCIYKSERLLIGYCKVS